MSNQLIKARKQLTQVRSHLKQDKYLPAAQALYDAVLVMLKNPLMKQEKEEFQQMVSDAVYQLDSNAEFRKLIPLKIQYNPGEEKALLNLIKECLGELQNNAVNLAKAQMEMMEKRKQEGLQKGQQHLDNREYDQARDEFRTLVAEFNDDSELKSDIGERFLKAEQYEDAYSYLAEALKDSPESLHLYNRIAISLRKLGKFDVAEKYYMKALEFLKHDPNLYFNLGRLYIDWCKWDKVVKVADLALKLQPEFAEAKKMRSFALKKIT